MNVVLVIVYILALLFTFFVVGVMLGALFYTPIREKIARLLFPKKARRDVLLARTICNPIMRPGDTPWTAEAVLNPAALTLRGHTHILYRAIGMDGVSRLGYASSPNGITFDDRPAYPAFVAQPPRGMPGHTRRYSPVLYPSGGSWGGCEDPRMVAIDGRIYVTYNAFDGWDFIRVACISISEEDFVAKRFGEWTPPHLLSRPGERHKNWVIFPEKINGKFAVLHSINPKPEVAYVDDLNAVGDTEPFIKSFEGARGSIPSNSGGWDHFVRSAGPPPIKTDRGWLVLYHAMSEHETHRYKLGAMLLDLADPTKIIARAAMPVLSPDEFYENDGKPGIVYAGGATVQGDMLYVYYGGADKVVCVAMAPINTFVDALLTGDTFEFEEIPMEMEEEPLLQ